MSNDTITRGHTAQPAGGRAKKPGASRRWLLPLAAAVLVAGAAAFAAFALVSHRSGGAASTSSSSGAIRVAGLPADVPTPLASLMGLEPVPHKVAPDFTLTDQNGKTLSLSSFRGHAVVLTFMDPRCRTICPIVSQEFVDAEHRLARSDPGVVFAAVNVNKHALGVATTATFTREHELTAIPTWHFFTGTLASLRRVWSGYDIAVATKVVKGKTTLTVLHSSFVYFIAPNGTERFLAAPSADYHHTKTHRPFLPGGTLTEWGRGIALVASGLAR